MEQDHHSDRVRIFMNDEPFELPKAQYTGALLKERTNVPPEDVLYRIKGQHREEIGNHKTIDLHRDEHFVAVPRHGGAG